MKLLGRTRDKVYFGRQPGWGKPVKVVMYDRVSKPKAGQGEFTGHPLWLGEHINWNAARESLRSIPGIELSRNWQYAQM